MLAVIFPRRNFIPFYLIFQLFLLAFIGLNLLHHEGLRSGYSIAFLVLYALIFATVLYRTALNLCNYLYILFDRRSRLVLDSEGLDDALTLYSIGRVEWNEIEYVEVEKLLGASYLLVHLTHPGAVLARQSRWKQVHLAQVRRKWGTPLVIPQRSIAYDIRALESDMNEHLEAAENL